MTVKLRGIAHRVAELSEGVPADVFYSEMKKLNEAKTRIEAEIQ